MYSLFLYFFSRVSRYSKGSREFYNFFFASPFLIYASDQIFFISKIFQKKKSRTGGVNLGTKNQIKKFKKSLKKIFQFSLHWNIFHDRKYSSQKNRVKYDFVFSFFFNFFQLISWHLTIMVWCHVCCRK